MILHQWVLVRNLAYLKTIDYHKLIENTQILSGSCCTTYSGTTNVIKNQFYRAKVTLRQGLGPWTLVMSWAYDSVSSVVPSTSLYYPTYITSAPIQVTVTCPSGYSTSTSAGYPQCVTTCGDGYRVGSEAWDDSNTTPNDGCSATCTVESGYTWTGGSGTSKDTCSKPLYTCPSGYIWTSGSCNSLNDCSQVVTSICSSDYSLSSFNRWMALSMWTVFIICFVLDLVVSWVTDKYPSGLFILLEHIQLITILPLAGSCFSSEVNGFFRLSRYSLLSFNFIDIKQLFYINSDYNQDNSVMNFIGFTSDSTIINISNYLLVGLCIVFVEMLVFKLYKCRYPSSVDINANTNECVFKTASRLKSWMPFGALLRYLLLGVVLINTAGFDELNNYSDNSHRWSWWLTLFLLFIVIFVFISLILYVILSRDYQALIESRVFSELVNGLKTNRVSKLYSLLFMIHRILIVMFLMLNMGINSSSKIISLIWIQFFYIMISILIRPFCSFKANLKKTTCEIFFLIILSLELFYLKSQDWTSSTPYFLIWLIWATIFINHPKYK